MLALSSAATVASAQILASSPGTFDVSQLGLFTLGSGQTLSGNGAVIGSVSAASGSILSPGFGVGTLGFTNDLTLNAEATLACLICRPRRTERTTK